MGPLFRGSRPRINPVLEGRRPVRQPLGRRAAGPPAMPSAPRCARFEGSLGPADPAQRRVTGVSPPGQSPVLESLEASLRDSARGGQGGQEVGEGSFLAPIIKVTQLEPDHLKILLDANFHTALDARYATSEGMVYSAFIHPLRSLAEEELTSAIHQVASLVRTFGRTFSSTDLVFPGGGDGGE